MKAILKCLACLLVIISTYSTVFASELNIQNTTVSGCKVKVIRVPLSSYRVKIGLAVNRVSTTEPLASIAKRNSASAAINGCFFNAYTSSPVKPPYHHLISGGKVLHVGNTGTTIGFDNNGDYRMERLKISLRGGLDGSKSYPNNWYSYFINHPVENSTTAIIYNRTYCQKTTPAVGQQAVVSNGTIVSVGPGPQNIPGDGYVVLFAGGESNQISRLAPGKKCDFRPEFQCEDVDFWSNAQEALGCGPQLVADGQIAYDPLTEGFKSAKILSARGQRSAVGVTRDKQLLLVTCSGATVKQLASVMKALGAYDAMNLDGGASSCLWANGKYLTSPGRNIGNALMVIRR